MQTGPQLFIAREAGGGDVNAATDQMLLASIGNGDRRAFELFLRRHLSTVTRFATFHTGNRSDAEDIAQETFLRVWHKASQWQDQGFAPRAWLLRIAYHLCIDELRLRQVRARQAQILELDAEPKAVTDADHKRLFRALAELPERQRSAIVFCALHGLSGQEAAHILSISIEALESLLARGRRKLREIVQQWEK